MTLLNTFKTDVLRLIEIATGLDPVTRLEHYARNDNQSATKTYFDVIVARANGGYTGSFEYKKLPGYQSALHRFYDSSHDSDAYNAKWVSSDGEAEEYVFKYVGSDLSGQLALLTDDRTIAASTLDVAVSDRNLGTYNFRPSNDALGHLALDILPWILWGNNENDVSRWTAEDRLIAFKESLGLGAYAWTSGILKAMAEQATGNEPDVTHHHGSGGWDRFAGTVAAEVFHGGYGFDTVDYSASDRAVTVSLERRAKDGQGFDGWATDDRFNSIEALIGSAFGDILIGDKAANKLVGGGGRDILSGKGGDDILDGGEGQNTIFGNAGDDRIFVHNEETEVDGGTGIDTLVSTMSTLSLAGRSYDNVEVFKLLDSGPNAIYAKEIVGSNASEAMVGNRHANTLRGEGGADYLDGGFGNDTLHGGRGNETYVFRSGWGVDVVHEDGAWDTLEFPDASLSELRFERVIGVNSPHLTIHHANDEDRVVISDHFISQNQRVERLVTKDAVVDLRQGLPFSGTEDADALAGTDFANGDSFDLKGGNDYVYAGDGEDTIIGGAGDDTLVGQDGDDTFVFAGDFGHDEIYESGTYSGETDSPGDTIVMLGFAPGSVSAEMDDFGRMTISVSDGLGGASSSIFIHAQEGTATSDGMLVEWIRFDNGPIMPLTEF